MPTQRVAPLDEKELPEELTAELGPMANRPGGVPNLFTTLARHPRLLKRWLPLGGKLLFRGDLPARERELLILRTAWNCSAHYEWTHHDPMAQEAGVSRQEIERVPLGPDAPGWSPDDRALLQAADELHADARISDDTWAALVGNHNEAQLIEICMLVGQYHLVAFALNSLGVQLETE